ncbi:arylsulfatase [Sphingomonas yabuuchiae]|uniref:Arylsulfatase n=1 Tax=Sphingomonas yabuuchiae TaxID=172044 RepID=A0A147IUU9_9SPHN|nr:arylsulfatase [Sphingomonas yabuuchiae]KTT99472.1 arylsulfatase [Sphingomonas yabuuchiae]
MIGVRFLTVAASALIAATPALAAPATPASAVSEPQKAPKDAPNFLIIVADDLGWSDLGAFGGEIATPNLDALALSGVRFTGFHTAPTCSPTRSMLMSGVDNHEAGLGTMAELLGPATRGQPGYEGYLNDRVASIAELLHAGGYATLMAGKWHLGLTPEREPAARGFEHSFALLQGLSNHFGTDQDEAWTKAGLAPSYRDDGKPAALPKGQYSADYFADRLIGYLDASAKVGDRRPFFAYLPFTTPHWPLQAPAETIAKYKGRYDAGYEALRAERLAKQKALGLVPADAVPHSLELAKPWASLTADERAVEARKMEVYAAMVDRMDQNVGRVIAALKAQGRYDNTIILFFADNGPEGNVIEAPSPRFKVGSPDAALPPAQALGIDNSLDNIGKPTSYVGYGPGWAQANSVPSWLVKGYTTEGGIRVSAFAAGRGVTGGGRIANANLDVRDVAPTLLDYAGLRQPSQFAGHAILPYEGHSLRPVLSSRTGFVRSADESLGYELFFRRALRQGDWKIVFLPKPTNRYTRGGVSTGRWQLFNVSKDPGETKDFAAAEPARLASLVAVYDRYAKDKGVVPLPADAEATPAPAARP